MTRSLAAMLCLGVLAACSLPSAHARPDASPYATASGAPPPSSGSPANVFVIVMENRSYSQALAGGYTAKLASEFAVATNYHGVSHPSLPNYLAMTSGT